MQVSTLNRLNQNVSRAFAPLVNPQPSRQGPQFRPIRSFSSNMKKAPMIKLNNGLEMPGLGLGTWQAEPGKVAEALKTAIEIGYRHIDCAMVYNNEKEIGEAISTLIKCKVVKREELFITTKLWNTFHQCEVVVDTCKKSLEHLRLDYVDLYLIHWPVAMKAIGPLGYNEAAPFEGAEGLDYDYVNTWIGMEECVRLGLAKSIGISNFNKEQVDRILENCCIKPVVNQFEVNLFNSEKQMIEYCNSRDIIVTAYSPFGSPTRPWAKPGEPTLDWKDENLVKIAKRHCKTVGQVLLRYLIQICTVPIPKSTTTARLCENLDVFDFELSPEEMQLLDCFNVNFRAVAAPEMACLPHYPFHKWF